MNKSDSIVIIPTYNEKENIEKIIRAVFSLEKCFHILVGVQLAENRIVRVQLDVLQGNFPQLIGKLGAVLRGQVGNQAAGCVVVSGAENRLGGRNAHLDLGSAGLLFLCRQLLLRKEKRDSRPEPVRYWFLSDKRT